VEIQTERLTVRPASADDVEDLIVLRRRRDYQAGSSAP
jgi:hypothetical protein